MAKLEYGVKKSQAKNRNQQALEAFILPLSVMPFDKQASGFDLRYARTRQHKLINEFVGLLSKSPTYELEIMELITHNAASDLWSNNDPQISNLF